MKVNTSISLVLPMFNEGPLVNTTLRTAVETLENLFADFEIVVADDASTDGCTGDVEEWTRCDVRVRLVRLKQNERFGGALRAGLAAGQKEVLVYTDFDLPVELDSLPRLLEELAIADILTGYVEHAQKYANKRQKVMSMGYNVLVRSLFGLRLRDINFGFKAMPRLVMQRLTLRSRSPFVDAEIFVLGQAAGFRVKEVPVPFSLRTLGESKIRRLDVIAHTLLDMARLRWRMFLHE